MKIAFIISFTIFFQVACNGQDVIDGRILDLKTKELINRKNYQFFLNGNGKLVSIPIDSLGRFEIDKNQIEILGDTLTFSIGTLGTNFNYADFEIINIPKDSLDMIMKNVYLIRAYMIPSCGSDCFTVNNKKTYKKKEYIVDNGLLKYKIKRVPYEGKIKQSPMFEVKYVADFRKDKVE